MDKFWILSRLEVETFFADQQSRIWGTGKAYWRRGPGNDSAVSSCHVSENGEITYNSAIGKFGVRPAFKI